MLASTILITASGVVTCAMRRTLVSRKARKKRIAENAEMNGDNFYQRENAKVNAPPPLSQQPTAPMVNGAPGADKLPEYATFESAPTRRVSDDDQIPLNNQSPSSRNGTFPGSSDDGMDRYGGGNIRGGPANLRGRGGRYNGPRDEFGNPLPPSGAFAQGPPGGQRDPRLRNQYSNETMNSQGSRGSRRGGAYPRGGPGRGGPGRGGPYGAGRGGPYNGRGGPHGAGRGGPNYEFGRGDIPLGAMAVGAGAGAFASEATRHQGQNQQGPPPGYANGYPPNGPPNGRGGFNAYGGPGPYARRQSPGPPGANYARRQSPGPPSAPGYGGRQQSPAPPSGPGYSARQQSPGRPSGPGYLGSRQPSPGVQNRQQFGRNSPPPPLPINETSDPSAPIGQAVEMDALHGSPANTPGYPPQRPTELRESDSDVAGLVNLQQQRATVSSTETPLSPSSAYSSSQGSHALAARKAVTPLFTDVNKAPEDEGYVPARTAWGPNSLARQRSPPNTNTSAPLPPIHQSPVERISPSQNYAPAGLVDSNGHARVNSGDIYYEDVDPRFADENVQAPLHGRQGGQSIPSLLIPGGSNRSPIDHPSHMVHQSQQQPEPGHLNVEPNSSYDSLNQDGTRSPAVSEASHFTSVSQRGVNPEWRPPPGSQQGAYAGSVPLRRPAQQRDVLLQGNPDFELPGVGPRGGGYVGVGGGPSPRARQGGGGFPPGNAI